MKFELPELDESEWKPKYPSSPEMYKDKEQFPDEHYWFEYYGYQYDDPEPH